MNTDKKTKLRHSIEVYKDGRIYQKRKKCSVGHETFDPDMDLRIPTYPYVPYEYKDGYKKTRYSKVSVEELMGIAEYVEGDKNSHANPVILHKDNDYTNNNSDNLEWVDESDPRYVKYYNETAKTLNALGREYNKYWPDFMDWKLKDEVPEE